MPVRSLLLLLCLASPVAGADGEKPSPRIVAHRGLLRHAPENTLANFRACLELRIGFEVDVRRSKDGSLVCVHDDTVDRTTNGSGPVAGKTLAELRQLDAGAWFAPEFRGEPVPTFDEVLSVVARRREHAVLIAIDLKAAGIEADVVAAAKKHGVLDRLLFIGNAIDNPEVRGRLRAADPAAHVACLAQTAERLAAALDDQHSDCAYLRFVPTAAQVGLARQAKKRTFIAGPTVAGLERTNWEQAALAGIDGILTDHPLELAAELRAKGETELSRERATPPPLPPRGSQNAVGGQNGGDQGTKEVDLNAQFDKLAARFVDEYPALSPVGATSLGDHRYDDRMDQVSDDARKRQREFCSRTLAELAAIDRTKLSRENQVDSQLVEHALRRDLWELDELQEWAWNPVVYTQLAGSGVYSLVARDYAPIDKRLVSVAARLEQYPRLYRQIRETLVPKRVPSVHAETAVKQNRGVLSTIKEMVTPHLDKLGQYDRDRVEKAIGMATRAVEEHQVWLEKELVPRAGGDFRIGPKLFDKKLSFALASGLTRPEIRDRAESELARVRAEMYAIARTVLAKEKPAEELPEKPSPEQQQKAIVAALEKAATDIPPRDGVVAAAQKSLKVATDFVRQRDLVTIPDDPIDIIEMPEFQRGVSVAYCDSPGPLEVGQKTFYAVAPLPADWSDAQCTSFLREYNIRSIHNLTVHEAMPGHFLQLAHANRNPRRLRALLSSGTFVEGWAVYTEQMLSEEGFLDRDPLMRLVTLKWYLRTIANAILDQSIHVGGIRRDEAMKLMMHDTFQEEREAAGKWTRAQLTSAQLSTYFIGVQEHRDLRAAAEKAWGDKFTLKRYHDGVLQFGSPPARYVRALLLGGGASK